MNRIFNASSIVRVVLVPLFAAGTLLPMRETSSAQGAGTVDDAKAEAERKALFEKTKEEMAKSDAEHKALHEETKKVLDETWSKDQPRVFEWDQAKCKAELDKMNGRLTELPKLMYGVYDQIQKLKRKTWEADPQLKLIADDVVRLTSELAAKKQELEAKVNEKAAATPEGKDLQKQYSILENESRKLDSIRKLIDVRLQRLAVKSDD